MSGIDSSSNGDFIEKKHGYEWYKSIGSPRYILAPMVSASEVPFRILCKNHGAQLVYTPMLNAHSFSKSEVCRNKGFMTDDSDQPLMVQFSGNDPDLFHQAVKRVLEIEDDFVRRKVIEKRSIVGISFNLGCSKRRAKKEHYGSFLMDSPELIRKIVTKVASDESIRVPISCKIRIFPDLEDTLEYVRMLVDCGITMLVVHGRTREQLGRGLCNMEAIRRIREEVRKDKIPVILNGISNQVKCKSDIDHILTSRSGGCDGVMISNAILTYPAIFEQDSDSEEARNLKKIEICYEYINIVQELEKKWSSGDNEEEEEESEGESELRFVQRKSTVKQHIHRIIRGEFSIKFPVLRDLLAGKEIVEFEDLIMVVKEMQFRRENNIVVRKETLGEVCSALTDGIFVFSENFSEEMRMKYLEKAKKIVEIREKKLKARVNSND